MNETHGLSKTREYRIFKAMKQRCYSENYKGFKSYGAKGIKVCDEWKDNFLSFYDWSHNNGYSEELTIDRMDNKKGYSPDNCQWITQHEQVIRQERNAHRTKEDLYIYENKNRFLVCIQKGSGKNIDTLLAQSCITKEEAVMARDYFLKHGKALNLQEIDKLNYSNKKFDKVIKKERSLPKHLMDII